MRPLTSMGTRPFTSLTARRTWALTVPAAQLPTGLESLLVARIASLPRDARRVAHVGAVLGRTFSPGLLAAVAGVEDLERNLTRLLRANIIREVRALPNREYAFTHGLLQEATLSTLTRARRRELYRRVAAAHEQASTDLDDQFERLAFYWARGGDLQRALDYLERAANRATSMSAQTRAAALWTRAASVAEKVNDPEARDRIERRLHSRVAIVVLEGPDPDARQPVGDREVELGARGPGVLEMDLARRPVGRVPIAEP